MKALVKRGATKEKVAAVTLGTITKKGRDYPQAYYHAQENGHKKSKYIPK